MELNEEYYQIGKRIEHLTTVLPQLEKKMWTLYKVLGEDFDEKVKKSCDLCYDLKSVERKRDDLKKTSRDLFAIEKAALEISMELNERAFEMDDFKKSHKKRILEL